MGRPRGSQGGWRVEFSAGWAKGVRPRLTPCEPKGPENPSRESSSPSFGRRNVSIVYQAGRIRGKVSSELSADHYRTWGLALGCQLPQGAKFLAAADVRDSSAEYLAALCEGLCRAGLDVVDLGVLPAPVVYYAQRRLQAAGCAVVTSGSTSAEYNGLEWRLGNRLATEGQARALRHALRAVPRVDKRQPCQPRPLDVTYDYVAWLQERFMDVPPLARHVVLDPMHGSWACRSRRYLQAVFPHTVFLAVRDQPSGTFGGGVPDCSRPELLDGLAREVEHQGASLGMAFDGAGGRVAFVDDQGTVLTSEETTWVFLQSFGPACAGRRFVFDGRLSPTLAEAASALGAQPIAERSDGPRLYRRMIQTKALFGAELGGRYFFGELGGADDALFAACWMIAFLASRGAALSELRRQCPRMFCTPELRVPLPAARHAAVLEQLRRSCAGRNQSWSEGLRIDFPGGWMVARSDRADRALVFRFGATDWLALDALVWRVAEDVPQMGHRLWSSYQTSQGVSSEP